MFLKDVESHEGTGSIGGMRALLREREGSEGTRKAAEGGGQGT